MSTNQSKYDIVISSYSGHFEATRKLLPMLKPYGTVHLASSFLSKDQIAALRPHFDVLHEPRYVDDGYENFALFCTRDINRLVQARHFIKLDADVVLRDDWISYVDETLAERPDAVLFGTHAGTNRVDYDISGPLVRSSFGNDLRVRDGLKVSGSFYVGKCEFFRKHDCRLQILHDLTYAFVDGQRSRSSHLREECAQGYPTEAKAGVQLRGSCRPRQGRCIEDDLRCLLVHSLGASDQLFVRDSAGRIVVHDKVKAPTFRKRAAKWLKRRLGRPIDTSRKHGS